MNVTFLLVALAGKTLTTIVDVSETFNSTFVDDTISRLLTETVDDLT